MPTKIEKDAITGTPTTGHEWDGIKELNTPLPKWWLYVLYASIAWSVLWWLLYPSWPGISGYFGGLIGSNQRLELEQRMTVARTDQAQWLDQIGDASVEEIAGNTELLSFAIAGGEAAFADNCAPCHGLGGAGQGFYPTLADDSWIWGGTLDDIHTTLLYGIRSGHDEARVSDMPAFAGVLERAEIDDVVQYVLALSGQGDDAEAAARGEVPFADNCAACHGEQGEGMVEVGAPALNDQIWLYGTSGGEIAAQIARPRHGVMPSWQGRLDPETIKILTVYVHALGGGH